MACNFSIKHYEEILKMGLKEGYRFIGFDVFKPMKLNERICVIRHDVDYMPEWAPKFGRIEKALGIEATYFFQVCAKTYNLREAANYQAVHELIAMGHAVGLHFDLDWHKDMKWEDVAVYCDRDKTLFQAITGVKPCDIVSFHNPHRFAKLILNQDIPKLSHTYEKRFFSSVKYISDSQGWREKCMCELFTTKKYIAFQFLTHPYLWPDGTSGDFIGNIAYMIQFRSEELTQYLLKYHPICTKNEVRLRNIAAKLTFGHH